MKWLLSTLVILTAVQVSACADRPTLAPSAGPARTVEPMITFYEDISEPVVSRQAAVPRTVTSQPPATGAPLYIVQPGDTLYSIARRHYGNGSRWPELAAANRSLISDPRKLAIGTRLLLPPTR